MSDFEDRLSQVLARHVDGFRALVSAERLSGGASQETYRIVIAGDDGERKLALRRGPGGLSTPSVTSRPGLRTEAHLMRCARDAGVPEPEVHYVLEPEDGLGDGFLMEWLEGETLGARIVRGEELAAVRPQLARQCGEILARIHGIDLEATGLDRPARNADPGGVSRSDLEPLPVLRHPAADDRLRGALAARPAAGADREGRWCTTTSATAT